MRSSVFWHITHWSTRYVLHVGFLIGLFFEPESVGEIFLRIVGGFSTDYTALYIPIVVLFMAKEYEIYSA
jgi:hypothetical protein